MKNLLIKTENRPKAFNHGMLTAALIGCSIFIQPVNANEISSVQSSLHTFSTENAITAINTDLTMLIKTKTPQEIEHRKPRKRKRRRRRRIFRRNIKDQ